VTLQLPEPAQLFTRFHSDATSDGAARERFEQFVTDLIATRHNDATTVAARNHNDWGLDTFVGDLGGGVVQVWQSKYFREWQGDVPQKDVRASFASAHKQAEEQGHRIVEWTLVVPAILHPKQFKWFAGWAKRQETATGTRVQIWQGDRLRRMLMSSEAFDVRREYFPHTLPPHFIPETAASSAPIVALTDDYTPFEDALFVRQLHEAGFTETGAACGMYFATDALLRDLEAKKSTTELEALGAVQLGVHVVWETRYNEHFPLADKDGRMPALYGAVITEVAVLPDSPGLTLQPAHKQGAAHMLVERRKAGWVKHWRDIAKAHPVTATPPLSGEHQASVPQSEGAVTGTGSDLSRPAASGPTSVKVGREGEAAK
jgi:hypothetical protein